MEISVLIEKLIDAIGYQYKTDQYSPKLVISKLENDGTKLFRVSIVRYLYEDDEEIVCRVTDSKLLKALEILGKSFLREIEKNPSNPIEELEHYISTEWPI